MESKVREEEKIRTRKEGMRSRVEDREGMSWRKGRWGRAIRRRGRDEINEGGRKMKREK